MASVDVVKSFDSIKHAKLMTGMPVLVGLFWHIIRALLAYQQGSFGISLGLLWHSIRALLTLTHTSCSRQFSTPSSLSEAWPPPPRCATGWTLSAENSALDGPLPIVDFVYWVSVAFGEVAGRRGGEPAPMPVMPVHSLRLSAWRAVQLASGAMSVMPVQ